MVGVISFPADKYLHLNDTTFSVSPTLSKHNKAMGVLSKVVLHQWQSNFD